MAPYRIWATPSPWGCSAGRAGALRRRGSGADYKPSGAGASLAGGGWGGRCSSSCGDVGETAAGAGAAAVDGGAGGGTVLRTSMGKMAKRYGAMRA